ncbi:MAG: apolipoprotein N-acyltransferase [Bdellovibrionales bacterium]|nr:apolipoprotein N-acyltransferase [Bdellovibrionales bacterium]
MNTHKITTLFSRHNFFFPLLSGIFIGTSYIPFPPWALFFAFVPLWMSLLEAKSLTQILGRTFVTQFTLSLIGFHWIIVVSQEHGHLPFPVAILILLLFCSIAMYYFLVSHALWYFIKTKFSLSKVSQILLAAGLFSLCEEVLPTLFPWNFGYPWLFARLPGFHFADVVGFQGLSTLTIIINAILSLGFITPFRSKHLVKALTSGIALFLAINLLGFWRKAELPSSDSQLNTLVVQANIGNLEKEYAQFGGAFRQSITNRFFNLTLKGLKEQSIDFAVWPETAFPASVGPTKNNDEYPQALFNFLKTNRIPLITGAYFHNPENNQTSNAIYYINEQGIPLSPPYKKVYLLAFGEYLPFGELFPQLKKMLPQVADFERGSGPKVSHFQDFIVGNQVCYEGLFPSFSRQLALQGAQFFVNLTNDSWFGKHSEPYQHLYMTLSRAIEFRRPLIRSTNTGISTAIEADGTILTNSPIFKPWSSVFTVHYSKTPINTIFMQFPWINEIIIGFIILFALFTKPNLSKEES